jgi:hypothetical protein
MPAAPECGLANGLPSVTVVTPSTCGQAWARPDSNWVCPGLPRSRRTSRHAACLLAFVHLVVAFGLVIAVTDGKDISSKRFKSNPALAGETYRRLIEASSALNRAFSCFYFNIF